MLRYIATKAAHARNPYPFGSAMWHSYNFGFIDQIMPRWPSRWELALAFIYAIPIIVIGLLPLAFRT